MLRSFNQSGEFELEGVFSFSMPVHTRDSADAVSAQTCIVFSRWVSARTFGRGRKKVVVVVVRARRGTRG